MILKIILYFSGTSSRDIECSQIVTQLEFPMQERLLPIGLQRDSVVGLVERVHQVFDISELQGMFLYIWLIIEYVH